MRLLMLTRYGPLGASSRLRAYQFVPYLESLGMEVTVWPLLEDAYLRQRYADASVSAALVAGAYARRLRDVLRARRFDLVWIEKELLQWLPGPVERLLLAGLPYGVDYDDAIHHGYDRHPRRIVRGLLGGKVATLMRGARAVVVGNAYLAAYARSAGAARVVVLPTAVDLERYAARGWDDRDEPFTVGWIGTPFTAKYLRLVAGALAEVCGSDGRVVLIGAADAPIPGVSTTVLRWSEATEASDLRSFDVGIMPLPHDPWALGKCGYKLIQYMACGLPVVASPVGINTELVEPGVNGFLADDARRWADALHAVRSDVEARRAMGAAGRRRVEERYCTAIVGPRLATALTEAVG